MCSTGVDVAGTENTCRARLARVISKGGGAVVVDSAVYVYVHA